MTILTFDKCPNNATFMNLIIKKVAERKASLEQLGFDDAITAQVHSSNYKTLKMYNPPFEITKWS